MELLQGRAFHDLDHAQSCFDPWRQSYNQDRPHEAIDLDVPANRYQVSGREYTGPSSRFEYDTSFTVRRVRDSGRIAFQGHEYRIGRALDGRWVGIRALPEDGQFAVYYRTFQVATISRGQGRPRRKRV